MINNAIQEEPVQPGLTDNELRAVAYFSVGVASEGSMGGRDVSNRLSFAGRIGDGAMIPEGNSGLSIGTLQTDLGQRPEVGPSLVTAYQNWAREAHPDWVLTDAQREQTIHDLGRNGRTIRAEGGRQMVAVIKSRLDSFLESVAGKNYVYDNDTAEVNKLMTEIFEPLRNTDLYRNAAADDQVRLAAMAAKTYNQTNGGVGAFKKIFKRIDIRTLMP